MDPAESDWGGEDDDIAGFQAVHRFLVGVEAEESALGGHLDLGRLEAHDPLVRRPGDLGRGAVERVVAAVEFLSKDVGHRDELDGAAGSGEGVGGGAGAPAAAADQGDADGIVLGGVAGPGDGGGQSRPGDGLAGGLQEFTAGGAVVHGVIGGFHRFRFGREHSGCAEGLVKSDSFGWRPAGGIGSPPFPEHHLRI